MKVNKIDSVQVKTEDGWYVSVEYEGWGDGVKVWIANKNTGKINICRFTKDGYIEQEEIGEGISPAPTMIISRYMWEGLRKAINGVEETPDKKALDAELTATKFHLEDMRKLVFKNKS